MKVREIKMSEIRPYWRNPRNNDPAVAAVKKSIEEFGMNQPIVVDGEHTIIVGHTRYKALLQLGWKSAPCLVRDDLPAEKVRAYRIADNKTSEMATWDRSAMVAELLQIGDGVDMQVYFPDEDLSAIVRQIGTADKLPQADDIEEARVRLEGQFEGKVGKEEVKLACPHCNGEIFIDKADFLRRGQ